MGDIEKYILTGSAMFTPLGLVIAFKIIFNNAIDFKYKVIITIAIMLIILFLALFQIISLNSRHNNEPVKDIQISNLSKLKIELITNYIALIIIPVLFVDNIFEIERSILILLVIIFIFVIYIKNESFILNPLLNFLGYRFFEATINDINNSNVHIITKANFEEVSLAIFYKSPNLHIYKVFKNIYLIKV